MNTFGREICFRPPQVTQLLFIRDILRDTREKMQCVALPSSSHPDLTTLTTLDQCILAGPAAVIGTKIIAAFSII